MTQRNLPKQQNPSEKYQALAPYNFVPLPEKIVTVGLPPDQDVYWPPEAANTGHITCTLTTLSPLYTRGMMNPEFYRAYGEKAFHELDETQKNERAQFFHIDDAQQPVIPGSSLRGMLRALVEIISYSKVQDVTNQPLVYRAVGDTTSHGNRYRERIMHDDGNKRYSPRVRAGYMDAASGGGWQIVPAQQINGTTFARIWIDDIPSNLDKVEGCKNAAHIYIQPGPYEYQNVRGGFIKNRFSKVLRVSAQPGTSTGLVAGTLARSGPMASKRTEAVVFPADTSAEPIAIPFDLEQAYREQISQEQQELLGKNGVLNEKQPVFYLVEHNKLIFFSHTMMMRLPYRQTPLDFVPKHLCQPEEVDLTEAIFGYTKQTGEGKAKAYAGRVFVSPATLESGQSQIWLKPDEVITPKILGGPKPTTFQHYLVQLRPDPEEVGRTKDGRPKLVKQLSDYAADLGETALRGSKLYWRKGVVNAAEFQESQENLSERDTQHTRLKPVAPEVKFTFKIYFENLSDKELGALLWALTLPGEPDKQYCHSLGMGKPLGLGAVKLEPTLYLDDRRTRYSSLFGQGGWDTATHVVTEVDTAGFINRFDHFIRQQIGAENEPSLGSVERIRMLLKLLEWPGPAREKTRYLEIERRDPTLKRGKVNEYKDRPVLPDPLHVVPQPGDRQQTDQPIRQTVLPPIKQPDKVVQAPPPPPPEPELSHPTTEAEVETGMYLEGQVIRVEASRVVVDIGVGAEASLPKEKVVPAVRDEYDLEVRFRPGKRIKVFVSGRNRKGRIQLTMQRQ
jgi:CRISPR-associated protein (TIGR03986 family)